MKFVQSSAVICAMILIGLLAPRVTQAAPLGGTFTVNSTADTNTGNDGKLTLREAILLANGGTGGNGTSTGLGRALSSGEKAQLSGCTIPGSYITGGCGADAADTILFSGIGSFPTITIAGSLLPPVDDTQPTTIDGVNTNPTIDATYNFDIGLQVVSNGNTLAHIGVKRARTSDYDIQGNNNVLADIWAWGADSGVTITGDHDTIDASRLGVDNAFSSSCGSSPDPGNTFNGVYITGNAQYATVKNSYIGCNGTGINIASLSIDDTFHTIGPNNRIGLNALNAGNLGNLNYGVSVNNHSNTVMTNTIGYNGLGGIKISGDHNLLGGNLIRSNDGNGIELKAWASYNSIGKLSVSGPVVSNTIISNLGSGIVLTDTATPPGFNAIVGNQIGVAADGATVHGNGGDGILVYGGHDTHIGGSDAQRNILGGNTLSGLELTGGARNSIVENNLIGYSAARSLVANGVNGIVIRGGAHDNSIGVTDSGNAILGNTGAGVLITDSGAFGNTVYYNNIGYSTGDGVAIRSGAHDNIVKKNKVVANGSAGVLVDSGAKNNRIGEYGSRSNGNLISSNGTDGIYLGGATTTGNSIVGNNIGTNWPGDQVLPNLHTGIALDGASGNIIGQSETERNIIVGNAWDGILMINGAHDNVVRTNDIGTNRDYPVAAGSAPSQPRGGGGEYLSLPNGGGISIVGSYTNTIGGSIGTTSYSNFIAYNTHTGVYLSAGSNHNVIDLNSVHGNGDYGVLFDGNNTAYNTITRTQIYLNNLDGIGERNNAGLNVWTEVSIHDNGGLGIDKDASNDAFNIINRPYVFFDSINRATGVVHGHADPSVLGTTKIELYRDAPDPSGYGEGGVFLGSTVTDVSGHWTITDPSPLPVSGCYTAIVTEAQIVIPFSSSEFSANTCRLFLPMMSK